MRRCLASDDMSVSIEVSELGRARRAGLLGHRSDARRGIHPAAARCLRPETAPPDFRDALSGYETNRSDDVGTYAERVPKLWGATIEAHRQEVRDAILDTTVALVNEHGLLSVTMSQVAEQTGIGRATLYKYFPDVEAILLAWHERNTTTHLEYLRRLADQAGDGPRSQLVAVLEAYALIRYHHPHDTELAAFVHRPEHLVRPQQRVSEFVRTLIAAAAKAGEARDDVGPDELAHYCVYALGAAPALRSKAAVHRLVDVVLDGVQP